MPSTVLIVDDEPNIRRMLGSLLRAEGYRTREAGSALGALAEVQSEEPDAVLMDLYMEGGETGLDALPRLREAAPDLPIIMMSGRASLSDAVQATRLGAFHFIEKPLTPEAVLLTLGSALELRKARELNRSLMEDLGGDSDEMVGRSPAVEKVRQMIERVAPTDARVLITGESGTGKEVAAAAIHRQSHRAAGPFIKLNCAAIPRDLVESEMFGHEKGAFTGATDRRRGRFELASGGTLFLDEIGDLSMEAQAKLLRALEGGEIERVGGTEPIQVDVRILAATNKDLRAEVTAGKFREDLFFRLHVIPLHLAPLRERPGDVPLLVEHFLRRNQRRHGLKPPRLTAGGHGGAGAAPLAGERARAGQHPGARGHPARGGGGGRGGDPRACWPATALSPVEAPAYRDDDDRSLTDRLDEYERQLLLGALEAADGNVAEAARKLQTDRANLYRRMRRLDVDAVTELRGTGDRVRGQPATADSACPRCVDSMRRSDTEIGSSGSAGRRKSALLNHMPKTAGRARPSPLAAAATDAVAHPSWRNHARFRADGPGGAGPRRTRGRAGAGPRRPAGGPGPTCHASS